jgi:hypothetical protein
VVPRDTPFGNHWFNGSLSATIIKKPRVSDTTPCPGLRASPLMFYILESLSEARTICFRVVQFKIIVDSRFDDTSSALGAVHLETALTDSHVFARRVAIYIFYLWALFHCHSWILLPSDYRSIPDPDGRLHAPTFGTADSSATFFRPRCGLLRHMQAGSRSH